MWLSVIDACRCPHGVFPHCLALAREPQQEEMRALVSCTSMLIISSVIRAKVRRVSVIGGNKRIHTISRNKIKSKKMELRKKNRGLGLGDTFVREDLGDFVHISFGKSDKGDFMSRSRSLYCHSDTGPTGPTAREIAFEIT